MNKGSAAAIAALAVLLAMQSWRVHTLKHELSHSVPAASATSQTTKASTTDAGHSEDRPAFTETDASAAFEPQGDTKAPALAHTVAKSPAPEDRAESKKTVPSTVAKKAQEQANLTSDSDVNKLPPKLKKNLSRAAKAFSDGDYGGALQILEDSVKEFPQESQAYASLAKMYNDLGMIDDAIKAYQDWTHAMPEDARAFLGAAGLYESLGMNAEALDSLAQYERLKDGAPSSYSAAASMYRRLGMPGQELTALTNWVDAAPTSPQAYLALGEYYRRNGDPASALTQYQQATTLAPGNVTAHSSLATAYQQLGQYENAQAELLTAISIHPGDTGLQMRLAEVYRRSGDLNSAIATYQNVILQEPNSSLALRASQQITRLQQQLKPKPKIAGL